MESLGEEELGLTTVIEQLTSNFFCVCVIKADEMKKLKNKFLVNITFGSRASDEA